MATNNGLNPREISLAESHEDRLQRVEENVGELAVVVGRVETMQKLSHEGHATIITKLESLDNKMDTFNERIAPIEVNHKERKSRNKSLRGAAKTMVLAALGAIAAGLGGYMWERILNHGLFR